MKKIIYTLVFFGILTSCKKDQIIDEPDEEVIETPEPEVTEPANVVVGYLYTSINGESTNQILKLVRREFKSSFSKRPIIDVHINRI